MGPRNEFRDRPAVTGVLTIVAAAIFGACIGHGIRRSVPAILRLKDPRMPFETPWLEILAALVFGQIAVQVVVGSASLPVVVTASIFAVLLMGIVATDYLVKLIPDALTFTGTMVGCGLHLVWPGWILGQSDWHPFLLQMIGVSADQRAAGLLLALFGAALGFLMLEAIRWTFSLAVGMQVMGMGDSKLLMMIGAFLGPVGAFGTLVLGFLSGVAHGLIYLKLSGQPHSPFGPPLAFAGWILFWAMSVILNAYAAAQQWVVTLPLELLAGVYTVLLVIVFALLIRTRRRAAEYEELIEEDYRQVDEKLE